MSNIEIDGGNYRPVTKKDLDEKYERGEIDVDTWIKCMKDAGLWNYSRAVNKLKEIKKNEDDQGND